MSSAFELSCEQSKDIYVIATFCCPQRVLLLLLLRELIISAEESVERAAIRNFR